MVTCERIIDIHQKRGNDYPSGEKGKSAIRYLMNLFMRNGCETVSNGHPLQNKLLVMAEYNYQWLIQYANKLKLANEISGFSKIAYRLINPETFLSVNNEIEVSLKFHLAGHSTSFIETDSSKPTPDLLLNIKGKEYHVEVSSLNPSDQETLMWNFHSKLTQVTIGKGLVTGGFINQIPNQGVLENIIKQVKENIPKIQENNETVKIIEPKHATIYLALQEKKEEIPKGCRGIFQISWPYKRTIEEKIERKIHEKYDQLFSSDTPSLLYLYSNIMEKQELSNLFKNVADRLEVIIPSYNKLIGLILTVPHLGFDVISAMNTSLRIEKKVEKIYLDSEIGKGQYESTVIWKNVHSDYLFPDEIGDAIENYSYNLKKLDHLSIF